MALEEELKAVIIKQLPQEVSATLQARLKKADDDEAALKVAHTKVETLRGEIEVLRAERISLLAQLDKHRSITEREDAVTTRERNQEVFELKTQLNAASGNADFARDVARQLVRNTEFRRQVFHSESCNVPVVNGGYTSMQSVGRSTTENTTDQAT